MSFRLNPLEGNIFVLCDFKNFEATLSQRTELGRKSFSYRETVAWNSIDRATSTLEKLDALKATLNCNKTSLTKFTFNKGTTANLNKDINFLYYYLTNIRRRRSEYSPIFTSLRRIIVLV